MQIGGGGVYASRIKTLNVFISNETDVSYYLSEKKGTASIVKNKVCGRNNDDNIIVISVDKIITQNHLEENGVGIIKVDTDGFDARCISSAYTYLKRNSCFLYWENYIDNKEQFLEFIRLSKILTEIGYIKLFVFDNFGNYISSLESEKLEDLCRYLWRIHKGHSARTVYYFDILACKNDENADKAKRIIDTYVSNYE